MKNRRYKPVVFILTVLLVTFFFFVFSFITKFYSPSLVVSDDINEKLKSNLDYIKSGFSSFDYKKINIVIKKIDVGSAEAKRYPLLGYIIIVDPEKLQNISDFELKGLFSHELVHLEHYSKMNWLQLGIFAVTYSVSDNFKKKVERETDTQAIEKEFGPELLAYREYRIKTGNQEDISFILEHYLSPDEIKGMIENQ